MSLLDRANPDDDLALGRDESRARVRWGIYAATAAAAFFIVGFVMLWQLALASVLSIGAPLESAVIGVFVGGVVLAGVSVACFASAASIVSRREHRPPQSPTSNE